MAKVPKRPVVELGPVESTPAYRKVAAFAAVGLAVGLAWPSLAQVRIGPHVPGAKKGDEAQVDEGGDAKDKPDGVASAAPTATADAKAGAAPHGRGDEAPKDGAENALMRSVVVTSGVILGCQDGKEKIEPEHCGKLRLDRVLVPKLEALAGCPSALGLDATVELVVDVDFEKSALRVGFGKKSALPTTTTNGVTACLTDYVRDVELAKLAHEHRRYTVRYGLSFLAGGGKRAEADASESGAAEAPIDRDLAVVAWDTALVRDEPRTGKVILRLVRGTRVKVVDGRKEWLEVKVGNKQGWLYRAALGR